MGWTIWLGKGKLSAAIGLGGVHRHESKRARVCGQFFTYLIILMSLVLLFEWQMSLSRELSAHTQMIINWVVWLFLIIKYIVLMSLVRDKIRFITCNWILPVIILLGLPIVFNYIPISNLLIPLRPLLAILLLVPSLGLLITFFVDGRLTTTLFAAFIIVVVFGILVSGVDPNIRSAWDGIWWALATVSTVGYGDVVPTGIWGRLIGTLLVILGLGIFVIITGNFLTLTLRKETQELKEEERELRQLLEEVRTLQANQNEIIQLIKMLQQKTDKIADEDKEAH